MSTHIFIKHAFLVVLFLVASLGSACQPSNTTVSGPSTPETDSEIEVPFLVPTPNQESGIVLGSLMALFEGRQRPYSRSVLYLAKVLKDSDGIARVAALDRKESPRASTNPAGQFIFVDVPPGEYALIVDNVLDFRMLKDSDGKKDLLLNVSAGQKTDLGTLVYARTNAK